MLRANRLLSGAKITVFLRLLPHARATSQSSTGPLAPKTPRSAPGDGAA
jgi:hypothetical protein